MKNFGKIICSLLMVLCIAFSFAGCGDEKPEEDLVKVTINYMDGRPVKEVKFLKGYVVTEYSFDYPKSDNWFFDNWYFDEACTQPVVGSAINKDCSIYAGWIDHYTIPLNENGRFFYNDYFDVNVTATCNLLTEQVTLTGSIAPKYDFTGEMSSDSFEIQLSYFWLSNEQFMGEYVNNDTVGYVSQRFTVYKTNNFTLSNINVVIDGSTSSYRDFSSPRQNAKITYIIGEPIIQFNHN